MINLILVSLDVIPLSDGSDSSTGLPSLKRAAGNREGFPDQPSPRPAPFAAATATVDLTSDSEDDLPLRRKTPRLPDKSDSSPGMLRRCCLM